jgi:hypothetical protein
VDYGDRYDTGSFGLRIPASGESLKFLERVFNETVKIKKLDRFGRHIVEELDEVLRQNRQKLLSTIKSIEGRMRQLTEEQKNNHRRVLLDLLRSDTLQLGEILEGANPDQSQRPTFIP